MRFDNEIHHAERDEARSARHALTEMQRYTACTHSHRARNGVCPCGDTIGWDE